MNPSPAPSRATKRRPNRASRHRTTERWNDADYAELMARADQAGMTVGSYIRQCALSAPTTRARHRAPVDIAALAAALRAFTKAAVNINQIARHLNTNGFVLPEELVTVAVRLDADRVAVMSLMRRP